MKSCVFILLFSLITLSVIAQVSFKTAAPRRAVVGEPFQLEYIIEDGIKISNFIAPDFKGFNKAAGPYIYSGNSLKPGVPIRNTVFTLVATKPGKFTIQGGIAIINGKSYQSNDVVVSVISKEEALRRSRKETEASDYFLHPGEDPYEKIRKNLFIKVILDKRSCFVGEAVVATFKLYSRLESKSDITKNPGFYGFTVYDMISLTDKQSNTELINGKPFDVHTIRKVQLYPLQEGTYMIDEMELKNTVEFSKSEVNKRTEQEITEGVLGNDATTNDNSGEGKVSFETTAHTEPISVTVKPIPEKNRPAAYTGATGNFSIHVLLPQHPLLKNEEGTIEITISGKGNFTQLNAPVVQWPGSIEGFEPVIKDLLDKTQSPLAGSRTFIYHFVSSTPGDYTLPPVTLSFFNPDSGGYKTISTPALPVSISNVEKATTVISGNNNDKTHRQGNNYWLYGAIALLIALAASILFIRYRKTKQLAAVVEQQSVISRVPVKELLSPARLMIQADDRDFYSQLQQAIWKFFDLRFHISGSEMSKRGLADKLREGKIEATVAEKLLEVLQRCEEGMFTQASLTINRERLIETTHHLLDQIDNKLF